MTKLNRQMTVAALSAFDRGHVEQTESGLLIPDLGVLASGEYTHRVNGGEWVTDRNTVTVEFINYLLEAGLRGGSAEPNWYMTLFGTGQTPDADWTASSFASLGTELDDPSDGYVSATRPAFTPGSVAEGATDNTASPVLFTVATAGGVTVGGIAILSDNTRGGSTGILASATNLANSRLFEDGDTYEVTYRMRFEAA